MGVTTSDKLLATLGLFTLAEPEWTVEAAAARLHLGTSTAYRFFRSLSKAGLISASAPGRYGLGPAIVELDRRTRLLDPLIRVGQPIMQRAVEALGVPGVMLLCRLFHQQVMCIHQEFVERPPNTVSYERGRPMPLYRGAASKAILANLPARTARGFYEAHRAEMIDAGFPADWQAVKVVLRQLRGMRVCMTSGELDAGMIGLGVPLRSASGEVEASLGFVLPSSMTSPQRTTRLSEMLVTAAEEIHAELGRLAGPATPEGLRHETAGRA